MEKGQEMDQFQLLEEKVDSLISMVTNYKREKESLLEKIQIQEGKISDLTGELENLRSDRNAAKQKILNLLEKMDQLDL
jgi:hypothetical protein